MKMFGKLIVIGCVIFGLIQLIRPSIPDTAPTAELQVPPEVRQVLQKDCYSCHSSQRRLSWFDQIVPAYWLVRHDVLTARERLNFSTLGSKPAAAQRATLYETVNMVQLGAMPLPQFVALHPNAKVTPEELSTLKAYLSPWTSVPAQPASSSSNNSTTQIAPATNPAQTSPRASLASVAPEPDGFPFDPSFKKWTLISTTDRGDNNSFRFILGNDIAARSAQTGAISPWPDGARFAKIAWQQEISSDGLIHPGKFIQVELMLKSAQRYKSTEGWGWGRWRGLDLKPYGADEHFVNECTGCHQPVRGDDYVYTLPMTNAKMNRDNVVNNAAAALPSGLPYQPLAWSPITMYVDPRDRTTATLFGNDIAMQAVRGLERATTDTTSSPKYPAGSVLALVTWAQRDDPHWFGGRIPNMTQSVEFVKIGDGGQSDNQPNAAYRRFAGRGLLEESVAASAGAQRISFMLGLAPVQLP
jgi:hypothetical protein